MIKVNPNLIDKSWIKFVIRKNVKKELKIINDKLTGEKYSPVDKDIFRFMNIDLNNVKYIIVGMDPYPGTYKDEFGIIRPIATGRAFEPANYESWLDSTRNSSIINLLKAIYIHETGKELGIKEIRDEISGGNFYILPPHELFDYLENQGILFINYSLTVTQGDVKNNSGSHINLWSNFSHMLIDYINNNYDVKWVLLGDQAKKLKQFIDEDKVIEDEHPRTHDFYKNNKCLTLMKKIDYTGKGAK